LALESPENQGSCPIRDEAARTIPRLVASDPQRRTSVRRQQDQDNFRQMFNNQQMINNQQPQQIINDMNNR
jgi:hypothetical protein